MSLLVSPGISRTKTIFPPRALQNPRLICLGCGRVPRCAEACSAAQESVVEVMLLMALSATALT